MIYDRDPRHEGRGKYNRFSGSFRIGLNGIVGFSRYPLHLISRGRHAHVPFAMRSALTYLVLRLAGYEIVWGNPTLVS